MAVASSIMVMSVFAEDIFGGDTATPATTAATSSAPLMEKPQASGEAAKEDIFGSSSAAGTSSSETTEGTSNSAAATTTQTKPNQPNAKTGGERGLEDYLPFLIGGLVVLTGGFGVVFNKLLPGEGSISFRR